MDVIIKEKDFTCWDPLPDLPTLGANCCLEEYGAMFKRAGKAIPDAGFRRDFRVPSQVPSSFS